MELIKSEKFCKLVASEGMHIRDINDVYVPESVDGQGNKTKEKYPHYSPKIYLPPNFTLEEAMELYVEEPIEE